MKNSFKVLICDDSLLIRKKLGESIRQCYRDAEIIDAKDGIEAIYMYRVHSPNLIFMDIIMPGKTGIEVVKEIKAINPDAKIIMVSSVGTKENLFKSFGAGAFEFIQKPWDQSNINKLISPYIPEPEPEVIEEPEIQTERVQGFEIKPLWKDPDSE